MLLCDVCIFVRVRECAVRIDIMAREKEWLAESDRSFELM